MIDSLTVDDLRLEVRWSSRRRTVQLTVDRGGELILTAPTGTPMPRLERFVRDKRFWLLTKLAEKQSLRPPTAPRELVSGESFHYLGRSHRLELVRSQSRPLRLHHGRFELLRSERSRGREHFVAWYTDHALRWLGPRVDGFAPRMQVEPAGVEVRDLGFRWGSCGRRGVLNFHWATISLPPRIVEYVIVHELAHLHELHHTPEFWRRVERVLPDYERRKTWLAEN
ncbi:MAG: SprT family zinc-dependent metalloprotease, partial [Nannocystaceae bacterium]